MKILVLGDIHANYPALKAVFDYVPANRFDRIINTGDLTVYATFPNETIQWFRDAGNCDCVLGNTDRRILRLLRGKKLKKPKKEEKRIMYFWTADTLLPENVEYLRALPDKSELTVGNTRIGIFHGTCARRNEALSPDAAESRFRQLAKGSLYRVHIMGHSHIPYYKIVNDVHFINPGSVGRMFDGDPRASFAILEVDSGKIAAAHFRIPYGVQGVVDGLENQNLPRIYAKMFQSGRKLN